MISVAPLEIYCGDIPVSGVREGWLEWGMIVFRKCLFDFQLGKCHFSMC